MPVPSQHPHSLGLKVWTKTHMEMTAALVQPQPLSPWPGHFHATLLIAPQVCSVQVPWLNAKLAASKSGASFITEYFCMSWTWSMNTACPFLCIWSRLTVLNHVRLFQSKALWHPLVWEQGKSWSSPMETARRWSVLSQWANSIERLSSTTAANCIQETESESLLSLLPLAEVEEEVTYLEAKRKGFCKFGFSPVQSNVLFLIFWNTAVTVVIWSNLFWINFVIWYWMPMPIPLK